jgi:hypothetical protein
MVVSAGDQHRDVRDDTLILECGGSTPLSIAAEPLSLLIELVVWLRFQGKRLRRNPKR